LFEYALRALADNGVDDPDIRLLLGYLREDPEAVKAAVAAGANPHVTERELVRRHLDVLVKPPVSEQFAHAVVGLLAS
jgi:hypothetical protein